MNKNEIEIYQAMEPIQYIWEDLLSQKEDATIFQTFAWNRSWVNHLMQNDMEIFIMAFKSNNIYLGILPLLRVSVYNYHASYSYKILRFIGYPDFDYTDMICTNKNLAKVVSMWELWLEENKNEWDVLFLSDVNETSRFHTELENITNKMYSVKDYTKCNYVYPSKEYKEYLTKLGRNTRSHIIRSMRKVENEYVIKDEASDKLEIFIKLHQMRWNNINEPGVFDEDRKIEFHREIVRNDPTHTKIKILYKENKPIAAFYLFEYNNRVFYYLSGLDPTDSHLSAGTVLMMDTIQQAFKKNKTVDLLRGNQPYKTSYANQSFYNTSFLAACDESVLHYVMEEEKSVRTRLTLSNLKKNMKNTAFNNIRRLPVNKGDRVLIIAPHFDDEVIGCGELICQQCLLGNPCDVLYLTDGTASHLSNIHPNKLFSVRKKEAEASKIHLGNFQMHCLGFPDGLLSRTRGVVKAIENFVNGKKYDYIFCPPPDDIHPDHSFACETVLQLRDVQMKSTICLYEILMPLKEANAFLELEQYEKVMNATKCHASQLGDLDYPRIMDNKSSIRGKQLGMNRCMVFKMLPEQL